MNKIQCYENYPFWLIFISNLLQLGIYVLGIIIMSYLGVFVLSVYLIYLIMIEIRIMKKSCVRCYYYGKYCAFGRGKISGLFFKKSNDKFIHHDITWKDIVPDFLVSIIPIVVGIVLLMLFFDVTLLALVILLFLLAFVGTGLVRGSLACKYCKQRELGCSAEKLFNKKEDTKNTKK